MKNGLDIYSTDMGQTVENVFVNSGVKAGFPVPSGDEINQTLDLNQVLIQHPAATFYAKVVGDSMIDAGVEEGDLLIIDRALEPQNGSMAVCFIDGEFTLKFIGLDEKEKGVIWLKPANDSFPPIKVTSENDFTVWGIVSYTIKNRLKK
ncbi:MAG: translesion error-prone DNA polymerase V autoproteolytic subunit [Bacteroidales bacterium]|nr:translesion error-prone DNA polymerase V autoproteolytic subunit [Bacteroidales bacterium]